MGTEQAELTYQEVLWLDVSVHNAEAVEVPEGIGQVVHHGTAIPLRVLGGRGNGIEEISTLKDTKERIKTSTVAIPRR